MECLLLVVGRQSGPKGWRGDDASFIHIHKVISLVLVSVSIYEKKNTLIDIRQGISN